MTFCRLVSLLMLCLLWTRSCLAISPADARYLLLRTGFSPSDQEVATLASAPDRFTAVAGLLAQLDFTAKQPLVWMNNATQFPSDAAFQAYLATLAAPLSANPAIQAQQLLAARDGQIVLMQSWWTAQMRTTRSPLAERLVLWLHNHFVAALDDPYYIWHLQSVFRGCGTSGGLSLQCLVAGVMHDPCVLLYLNQVESTAAAPVANFGRELMEIYTIGIGNYTETDVSEVARALTGLDIGADGMVTTYPQNHDNGSKTILGRTGNWGPSDVQRILLAQKSLAPRIVGQLWQEFISPTPDPAVVAPIAADLARDPQLRLVPILGELLTSQAFWDPRNRGALVKSPAEFVTGALRQFGFAFRQEADAVTTIQGTGEFLWGPPNVRGFLTGTYWINTGTLLERQGAALQIANEYQAQVLAAEYGANIPLMTPAQYAAWASVEMADQPLLAPPAKPVPLTKAAQALMSDPAYWLK